MSDTPADTVSGSNVRSFDDGIALRTDALLDEELVRAMRNRLIRGHKDSEQLGEIAATLKLNFGDTPRNHYGIKLDETQSVLSQLFQVLEHLTKDTLAVCTVLEARKRKLCRICGKPERTQMTYNFGHEFAHTQCYMQSLAAAGKIDEDVLIP